MNPKSPTIVDSPTYHRFPTRPHVPPDFPQYPLYTYILFCKDLFIKTLCHYDLSGRQFFLSQYFKAILYARQTM